MSTMNNEAKDLFDYFMQNVNINFKILKTAISEKMKKKL